jgi:hypothetical protein
MKLLYYFLTLTLLSTSLLAKTLIDNKNELKSLIVNQRLTSNLEDFYFMEDGTLLYHELDNDNVTNGLWFIKQATFNYDSPSPYKGFEPSQKELKGKPVICIAVNVTSKEEFSWLPCTRLYKEQGNLYIAHQTQCNLDEPVENDVIHCNWTRRVFFNYRLNAIEE